MSQNPPPVQLILTAKDETRAGIQAAVQSLNSLNASVTTLRNEFAGAKTGVEGLQAAAAKLGSVLGTALGATTLVNFARGILDVGDELNKLSQKTGIAVERLSELKFAAELGGVDTSTLGKGLREFNKSLVEASDSSSKAGQLFKALGVDITAGPDKAFRQFAEAFSQLPEGELRAAAAAEILKKAGSDLIPVLAGGAKALDDSAEAARKLGIVMSADFASQAERFNDNLTKLGKGASALGIALGKDLLPAMVSITDNIVDATLKGEKWLGIYREINKLLAAGLAQLPESTPLGKIAREQADKLFGPQASRLSVGKIGGLPPEAVIKKPPNEKEVRKILAGGNKDGTANPLSGIEGYVSSLREQLAGVEIGEFEKQLVKLNETFGKVDVAKLTKPQYNEFIAKAAEAGEAIERLRDIALNSQWGKAMQDSARIAAEAIDKAREASDSFVRSQAQQAGDLEFELSLVGKVAREREKLIALRKIQTDATQAKLAIPDGALNRDAEVAAIEKAAAESVQRTAESIDAIYTRGRDAYTGLSKVSAEYFLRVTDDAQNFGEAFVNIMGSVENSFVQFASTGKFEFKGLVNSIVADLARIVVRQQITAPLAQAVNGALGGGSGGGIFDFILNRGGIAGGGDPLAGVLGFAGGGRPPLGRVSIVGEKGPELFVPDVAGTVVPNGGFGGVTVNQYNNIDSRTDQATIAQIMAMAKDQTKSEILDSMGRGGPFSRR
jgi:hypothetical protein